MNRQNDICKVVTLGDSGVGKTCLLQKIKYGTYNNENSMTIGIDCLHKTVDLGNKLITLELWDTAGQERFDAMNKLYIRNVMCILLVYDITNEESCFKLNKWCDLIDEQAPSDVIKILVGNKCDKRTRMITTEIGQSVADYLKMPFIEISSKEDVNVDELMDLMLVMLVQLLENRKILLEEKRLQDAFRISQRDSEINEQSGWEWLRQYCSYI
ncbi:uncharacterized protein LOC126847772 isoform X9 [Adelges cooleyi]|uniref:uncharacterized protein LOC126847772 isoform X9 n=1 Tax=Adelges cooleyi TaxID=133065 RepID=UPI00217FDF51|nr:uncharacterized protein LOC126847772 isoform X9 [Adelges cooleyi]